MTAVYNKAKYMELVDKYQLAKNRIFHLDRKVEVLEADITKKQATIHALAGRLNELMMDNKVREALGLGPVPRPEPFYPPTELG